MEQPVTLKCIPSFKTRERGRGDDLAETAQTWGLQPPRAHTSTVIFYICFFLKKNITTPLSALSHIGVFYR